MLLSIATVLVVLYQVLRSVSGAWCAHS